jgi:RNA polymerase-binding transcription factor DksA
MMNIEKARQTLRERLRMLTDRLEDIDDDLTEHEEEDVEERATEIASDEVLEGLGISGLREIEQIGAALKRIEIGTYGRCTRCREPIDERRLAALPHAAHCFDCESTAAKAP